MQDRCRWRVVGTATNFFVVLRHVRSIASVALLTPRNATCGSDERVAVSPASVMSSGEGVAGITVQ